MDDSAWIFDLVPIPDFIFDGLFIKELFDENEIDLAIPAIIFFVFAAIVHLVRFYTCACMKGKEIEKDENEIDDITNKGLTLFYSYIGTALLEDAPQLCLSILYLSRRIGEDPDYEWTKVQMVSLATSFTSIAVLGGRFGWLFYKVIKDDSGICWDIAACVFLTCLYWFTAVAPAAIAVLTQSTLLEEATWTLAVSITLVALFGVSCCCFYAAWQRYG